jgi:hypothetical protein
VRRQEPESRIQEKATKIELLSATDYWLVDFLIVDWDLKRTAG